MLNCVRLFETLWTVPHQAPLSMGFFILLQARMLEWVAIPPPGDLPNPGIEPVSLVPAALAGDSLLLASPGKPLNWYSYY